MTNNKKMLAITIICISLFQMGMVGLTPVISAISNAFPDASELAAQMATTFLNLILVVVSLLSGVISRIISRRWMAIIGISLLIIVAVCGYFFTLGLWAVYLWSGLLGAGTGLFVPAASSMMIDYLGAEERKTVVGRQTAAVNLGGVVLSMCSGILAAQRWNNAYLVFISAIPVLVMCIKYIPQEQVQMRIPKEKSEAKVQMKIPAVVWSCTFQTMIFAAFYFTFSTNISLLLAEKSYGESSLAGTVTAIFMLGGCICGLLFRRVSGILKSKTAIGAFILLAMSFLVIYFIDGLTSLFLAAFIGGGSLSIIFPFFLVSIADHVDPAISVISTSLIISVGPNLGSFLSPMIITNISLLTGNTTVVFRFFVAAVLSLLVACALLMIDIVKRRKKCLSDVGLERNLL